MKPIRVLAVLEATTVTGPAKNLLQFARIARDEQFDPQVEVSIATFRREGDSEMFLDAAGAAGIPVHFIPERGRFDRSVIPSVLSLVRKLTPDIVQTHAVKSHFLIRWAGLHRLAPWVAFHHGYTWPNLSARLYNQLDRWSLRAARRVVTVSAPFRDQLVAQGVAQERIVILHNAIAASWATSGSESGGELRTRLAIGPDQKVILIVGRLSREKDHLTLLGAIDSIRREDAFAPHLLVVGEGPERPRIEARVRALGLESHVTLTGQTRSAELYYAIADAAVLSSRSEGSPNALLEAMAAGVPVIATAVGGVPEMVEDHESALLVAPGDQESMARALTAALTDRGLAETLRTRARQLIRDRYAPERRARALGIVYRELLTGR